MMAKNRANIIKMNNASVKNTNDFFKAISIYFNRINPSPKYNRIVITLKGVGSN